MNIVICPGIHDSQLTQAFCLQLQQALIENPENNIFILPQDYPAYSGIHILQYCQEQADGTPLVFIGFSAGVVGAIAAAWGWQLLGYPVVAFFAFDGWGVPLYGDFPIYRLSHDYFTHWTSAILGDGESSFYADPSVEHLEIWRSPHTVQGWSVQESQVRNYTTALQFLTQRLG